MEDGPQKHLGHVEGLGGRYVQPHYPVTGRMVTDQIHLEFGSDDETDGGNDDGEAEKPEEALVLAFRDDGYPLLPAIDSNTPDRKSVV